MSYPSKRLSTAQALRTRREIHSGDFLLTLQQERISRRPLSSFKKILNGYKAFALILVNTTVLGLGCFVGLNLASWAIFRVWDSQTTVLNPVNRKYGQMRTTLYPGMTPVQINQLLNETWTRRSLYEPFVEFREQPYEGVYVHVDSRGFRRIKNQGPWPPDPRNFNIFVFGGSTTFGYGIPDDWTIPSQLQRTFENDGQAKNRCVYNFGRSAYYSSQERILFENLLIEGRRPDMAIFIDGLNEFMFPFDRPAYTAQLEQYVNARPAQIIARLLAQQIRDLPMNRFLQSFRSGYLSYLLKPHQPSAPDPAINSSQAASVIHRYIENKKYIEKVGSAYKVIAIFVWQPVPFYNYDLGNNPFAAEAANGNSAVGYPLMAKQRKREFLGRHFLWFADMQRGSKENYYVDAYHYSGAMCRLLAWKIHDFVSEL